MADTNVCQATVIDAIGIRSDVGPRIDESLTLGSVRRVPDWFLANRWITFSNSTPVMSSP